MAEEHRNNICYPDVSSMTERPAFVDGPEGEHFELFIRKDHTWTLAASSSSWDRDGGKNLFRLSLTLLFSVHLGCESTFSR